VNVWSYPLHDNGLFITYLFIAGDDPCEEVEKQILDEYGKIISDGVAVEELQRAKSQIKAQTAFTRDGTYSSKICFSTSSQGSSPAIKRYVIKRPLS
jgi:predicted Zn-dependent peptidase